MTKRIELNIKSGVAEVKLNRPEKHNALDHAMFESLIEFGEKLATYKKSKSGKAMCQKARIY